MPRTQNAPYRLRRPLEARIKKDRAEQGLQGVRQNRCTAKTAGLQLAATEAQVLAQPEFPGNLRQGLAAHQGRPQPRQGALIRLRIGVIEHARDRAIEDRVPQELEPLIVLRAGTAMRERRAAQGRFGEHDPERFQDPGRTRPRIRAPESLHLHCLVKAGNQRHVSEVRHGMIVSHVQRDAVLVLLYLDVLGFHLTDIIDVPMLAQ